MGKVRSKKCSKISRPDPTGLSKVENDDGSVFGDLGPVSTFVQTNVEQLQSPVAEERDSGLNSLSAASSKPAYLKEILKGDILKVVAPLLLDPSVSVRHSAAGALRNLSSISMDVCEKIIAADVLTPLVTLIKQKYSADWTPMSKEKHSKQPFKIDSATEAFIESVTLLWNLCEAGEIAVKVFNQEKLGDVLLKFLNVKIYGLRVALSSALCLYSATEDNTDAVTNHKVLEEILVNIINISDDTVDAWQLLYFQCAAIGIVVNLNKGDLRQSPPEAISLVMGTLNKILEVDHLNQINRFTSEVPLNGGSHQEIYHRDSESDLKKIFEVDEKCESVMALISSQLMALEILSNIVITDEIDSFEDDDEDDQESMDGDFEGETESGEQDVEMKDLADMPEQVYECLSASGLVAKVLSKIKSLPVNVKQILSENDTYGQNILRKQNAVRSTALICLQNLIEVLSLAELEKCIGIKELWTGLGSAMTELGLIRILFKSDPYTAGPNDETMVEATTSALRAIIQSAVSQKTLSPAAGQLCGDFAVFNQVYETVNLMKVKVNVMKIIGCSGLLLMRFPKDASNRPDVESLLTQIVEYLLNCLATTKPERQGLWLAAEVLDTIFDVFAEDDFNHILKKVQLIQKLKTYQPQFKKQVRCERRSLGEHAAVIQTSNTNLPRFIQYKEKHGAV